MAIVTFMSDFGTEDHYVAAVKAKLLSTKPDLQVVDISHQINPSDIGHAAYVLKSVFRDFPTGTVHLCAVDMTGKDPSKLIALKLEEHYFVGYDSGVFSLLGNAQPAEIIEIKSRESEPSTFAAKDILAPAAARLADGENLGQLGSALEAIHALYPRQLKLTKREIVGNVMRVDHYGNLISNIVKSEFDTIMKINGHKPFEVCFGREKSGKIHNDFHEVESGEYFVIFNSNQVLQIGINKGNASELLGLGRDSTIIINFEV